MSLNYAFIVDLAAAYSPPPGRFLDFGCGMADVAALALARGYDAYGVDTYLGVGATGDNLAVAQAKIGDRVSAIHPGEPTPFPDADFDVVISNQVFEHVENVPVVRDEIARILRPGGLLLAMMPTYETLWEGHLRMPFVHRFKPGSPGQRRVMAGLYALGFGVDRRPDWVDVTTRTLQTDVFYRTVPAYIETLKPRFALIAQDEPAWARHRIANHAILRKAAGLASAGILDPVLRQAVRRTAGAVLVLRKS